MWVAGPALWHAGMRVACNALQQRACAGTELALSPPPAGRCSSLWYTYQPWGSPRGPGQPGVGFSQPAGVPCGAAGGHHARGGPQAAQHEPPGDLQLHLGLRQVSPPCAGAAAGWQQHFATALASLRGAALAHFSHSQCAACHCSAQALVGCLVRALAQKLWKPIPTRCHPALSLRRFAYHPGPVMVQYQAEIGKRVDKFDGQSLTTTLWALAALSVRPRSAEGLQRGAAVLVTICLT